MVASPDRQRNPLRTRAAILDAAATLFAERGYAATSLADVGARAGVSRGAPGYCFGSKAELYRAILERAIEEVRAAVRSGRERALASGRSSDDILAGAIG
ncbi:MAG TPA: TetR family transcriptional regulator, partial [Gemmatimonadales bacterium]|nr:TetR family transcriptional regulator [Gemmatimonadales bacterium]